MPKTVTCLTNINTFAGRVESFCNFVADRENIRLRKERGDARPWTPDPILQTYHFCNVRRADDRVTKWIGEWVQDNFARKHHWFAYCVARWFNSPETLELLTPAVWPFQVKSMVNICKEIKSQRASVFRGSYIINSAYDTSRTKWEAVIYGPLTELFSDPPSLRNGVSLEDAHMELMRYTGHGSFMAGQIVADWQTFGVMHGKDVRTWAPLGPGSNRGLKWIYADAYRKRSYVEYMRALLSHLELRKTTKHLATIMTLHDVQNCLCEFSKYVRGYSKTKYSPYQEELPL